MCVTLNEKWNFNPLSLADLGRCWLLQIVVRGSSPRNIGFFALFRAIKGTDELP